MKKTILVLFMIISNHIYAQEIKKDSNNPRLNRPLGLNFNILGPSILGLSTDYFITSKVNIEAGIGFFGYYGGATYHFNGDQNNRKWTPYTGAYLSHLFDIGWDEDNTIDDSPENGIYIPFGLQYLNNDGITIRFELATGTILSFYGSLKLGYHF